MKHFRLLSLSGLTAVLLVLAAPGRLPADETTPETPPPTASDVSTEPSLPTLPSLPSIPPIPAFPSIPALSSSERVALMGQKVELAPGQKADQVVAIMSTANVDGTVAGNVVFVLGQGRVNGEVYGNLVTVLSDVKLGPGAKIHGETVSVGQPLDRDPGAQMLGQLHEVSLGALQFTPGFAWFERNFLKGVFLRPLPPKVPWAWMLGLFCFIINAFIALLLARPVRHCTEAFNAMPIRSLLVGLLAAVLFVPLLTLLLPTVVGGPLLLCAAAGTFLLGKVVIYQATGVGLGRQLGAQAIQRPFVGFLVGTLIFYLCYMIPVFGWLVWLTVTTLGIGAVILGAFTGLRSEMKKNAPTSPPPASPPVFAASPVPGASVATAAAPAVLSVAVPPPTSASEPSLAPPLLVPPLIANAAPSSAELASLPRVGFWPRLGASAIDLVLLAIASNLLPIRGAFPLFALAYHVGMWAWRGTTIGGIVFQLQVIRVNGSLLDWKVALVRSLASLISLVALGLGFFWASWTQERQSWHDVIAGTTIVKVPRSTPLL